MLTPEIQAVLDEMNAAPGPPPHEIPVADARAAHAEEAKRLCGPAEEVAEVHDLRVGQVPVRAYRPEGAGPLPIVAYLHGGGWMMGEPGSYDSLLRALANASGAIVAGVDYRLSPEYRFPAALDDSLAAVRWLAANAADVGGDGSRLAVVGDSAGGNLAAVVARRLRGELALRAQVLIYPVIDASFDTESYERFKEGHGLSAASMQRFWRLYLDGADPAHPDASPLRTDDFAGVAPAYVLTAEEDVLRDEGEAYADALEAAGVETELVRWPGTIHGFFRWLAVTPAAREAVDAVGARLRTAFAAATVPRMVTATATTRFWHPFADMGSVSRAELVVERGEGVHVFDTEGKRYLDATASLWYANLGHGRAEIADAVAAQMRTLEAYSTFGDFGNKPANELCERLARLAPMDDARVFLGSGGGDAIDTAAKIARRHWVLQGQPERVHLISRTHGYHGTHGFGTSIGGIEANVTNWGPLVPAISSVPYDSLEALEAEILRVGPDRVAAFFCEPVIGAGGVYPPPEGYIEGVADLCAEHGVLLVIDSVICGFGRLGTWFGVERWEDVRPDLVTFAKGVTSGYLPLGGVMVSGKVAGPFFDEPGGPMLRHGATYAGHPTVCAAALTVLDIYERENIIPRGRELEGALADALAPLADHPAVAEVRAGLGLLAAVQLAPEVLESDPGAVAKVALGAREAGVLLRPLLGALAVSPPLVVEQEHLEQIADGYRAGLDRVG